MANFGPLTAEMRFGSLGHPSKFQRVSRLAFVTAPTSLTGDQSNFARCLAVYWACTVYIHFRELLPLTEFCPAQNSLYTSKFCVRLYWQRYCTALQQRSSVKLCGVVQRMQFRNFRRGRHLYSAGRPSRWASAHILILDWTGYLTMGCPILMATGFVIGKWQFSTPNRIDIPQPITKSLSQMIRFETLQLCKICRISVHGSFWASR